MLRSNFFNLLHTIILKSAFVHSVRLKEREVLGPSVYFLHDAIAPPQATG